MKPNIGLAKKACEIKVPDKHLKTVKSVMFDFYFSWRSFAINIARMCMSAAILCLLATGSTKAQTEILDVSQAVLDFHNRVTMNDGALNCQYRNEQLDIEDSFLEVKSADGGLVKVFELLCYPDQHRSTSVFYRIEDNRNKSANDRFSIQILSFPTTTNGLEFSSTKNPLNAEIDFENKTIISEYAAPHFISCGFSNTYKWDGKGFSLFQARAKPCCKPLQQDVESGVEPASKKKYRAPKWDGSEEDDKLIDKIMQDQDEEVEFPLVFDAVK